MEINLFKIIQLDGRMGEEIHVDGGDSTRRSLGAEARIRFASLEIVSFSTMSFSFCLVSR